MKAIQTVEFETLDENLCAAFDVMSLDVCAELECDVIQESEGAHGFYQDFTVYEDQDVCFPVTINDVDYTKDELLEIITEPQLSRLEDMILNAVNDDNWNHMDLNDA